VKEQKRISFADIEDTSDEALLQSWKGVFEAVMSFVSQAEERVFIFPSKSHLELFHIIKSKTGFRTQSKSNAYFKSHKAYEDIFFSESLSIEKMIAVVQIMGAMQKPEHPDYYLVWSKKKKTQSEHILANTSYSYIADIRTGLFHDLKSFCLNGVPGEFMRGLGKRPLKTGFKPCPICIGKYMLPVTDITPTPSIDKKKALAHQSKSEIMRSQIRALSVQYGMHAEFHGSMVYVTTIAGEWYFDYNDRPIKLKHKNSEKRLNRYGKPTGHYHNQELTFHAPLQVLSYIRRHEQAEIRRMMEDEENDYEPPSSS